MRKARARTWAHRLPFPHTAHSTLEGSDTFGCLGVVSSQEYFDKVSVFKKYSE